MRASHEIVWIASRCQAATDQALEKGARAAQGSARSVQVRRPALGPAGSRQNRAEHATDSVLYFLALFSSTQSAGGRMSAGLDLAAMLRVEGIFASARSAPDAAAVADRHSGVAAISPSPSPRGPELHEMTSPSERTRTGMLAPAGR